ncbi:MAG: hypothetical protein AAF587_24300 [Bacteroidota bacterium]
MSRFYFPFLLLFVLFFVSKGWTQCCSPGNPIGGTSAVGVNDLHAWQFFLTYRYGYSGAYFEETKAVPADFIEQGNYNHVGMLAAYGLAERITIEAETGVFLNKTQSYVSGILPAQQIGRGLTDLSVTARINVWKNQAREIEITGGAGFKAPLGPYEQRYQGAILSRDLQPTTGSFDGIVSLFVYKGFLPQKIRFFLLGRAELKGQNPDRYRYGNFLALSGFATYSAGIRWVVAIQVRTELRARDSRPLSGQGIPIANERELIRPTGSEKVFVVPQISYALTQKLNVSLLMDWPVYQRYNDKQLATTLSASLSLRYVLGGGSVPSVFGK